ADFERGRLVIVFLVLRRGAERAELENFVVAPDAGMPLDHDMRPDARAVADLDMLSDDRIRPDFDVSTELRARMNDGGRMNHHLVFTAHISSASAASWPSTRATPLYL